MLIRVLLISCSLLSFNLHAAAKIEQWHTSKGVKVLYTHSPSLPMLDIELSFDAGSARNGNQHGLASLTASLLDQGAGNWNADQIAAKFDNIGAQFGVGAGMDSASLSLRSLTKPKLLASALNTMQIILTQPKFAIEDFKRQQKQVLAALKHREESPAALASLAFHKSVFGKHPYAYSSSGYLDTVSKLTPKDLKKFYQQYYVAKNAMLVIVGAVDKQQAQAIAETLTANLAQGTQATPLPTVTAASTGSSQYINFPSKQTHVLVGMLGVNRQDKDYVALYVGNHILGGSGLVSKLFAEVREKRGLAYSAYSYFAPRVQQGTFTMGLQTKNSQTQAALKVLNQTLQNFITQGVTAAELTAAKKNITGGFVLRFDTNSKLMGYLSMIGRHNLPLDYLETFPQRVAAITSKQIQNAFQTRVLPKLMHTITVGGDVTQNGK